MAYHLPFEFPQHTWKSKLLDHWMSASHLEPYQQDILFLASLQASKFHLVLLLVLAGVIPLEQQGARCQQNMKSVHGLVVNQWWFQLLVVVSVPATEGGAELGGLFGCGVVVISLAAAAAGQSVHSQNPRQRVIPTSSHISRSFSTRSLPLLGLFSVSKEDLYWGHSAALTNQVGYILQHGSHGIYGQKLHLSINPWLPCYNYYSLGAKELWQLIVQGCSPRMKFVYIAIIPWQPVNH